MFMAELGKHKRIDGSARPGRGWQRWSCFDQVDYSQQGRLWIMWFSREVFCLNYAPNNNTNNIPNIKANIIDLKSFLIWFIHLYLSILNISLVNNSNNFSPVIHSTRLGKEKGLL